MRIKGLTDEDFINYKVPAMFISTPECSFKCDHECGERICQNLPLLLQPTHDIENWKIVNRYLDNPITKAIVFGGLEPFDTFEDMFYLINEFRIKTTDDIVIYTGYTKEELSEMQFPSEDPACSMLAAVSVFKNIVIKFGRYIPNRSPHLDETLGVYLASDNQYAERIS